MENLDLTVLRGLRDWRRGGRRALLLTVVRTWGSSPRPVGSIMALRDDGAMLGSVSGGCIEDDLAWRYAQTPGSWPEGAPQTLRYGVSADEAHRFGLPCGGTLELVMECEPDAERLDELVRTLEAGRLMTRCLRLADGAVRLEPAAAPEALAIADGELRNTFGPEYRMLLIGAGQLAEFLASMALASGFAVTLCDPREAQRATWSHPGVTLSTEMPDDAVSAFRPDARSAVIALSHDPKLDDLAIMQALASEAFYIGAIGSRRNNRARRERLAEHFGIGAAALARLRGPIGIYIGSKTPAEIAVSVMAEVLAVKNGVAVPDVAQGKAALAGGGDDDGAAVLCGTELLSR